MKAGRAGIGAHCAALALGAVLLLMFAGPLVLCALAARYADVPVVADAWAAEAELIAARRLVREARP